MLNGTFYFASGRRQKQDRLTDVLGQFALAVTCPLHSSRICKSSIVSSKSTAKAGTSEHERSSFDINWRCWGKKFCASWCWNKISVSYWLHANKEDQTRLSLAKSDRSSDAQEWPAVCCGSRRETRSSHEWTWRERKAVYWQREEKSVWITKVILLNHRRVLNQKMLDSTNPFGFDIYSSEDISHLHAISQWDSVTACKTSHFGNASWQLQNAAFLSSVDICPCCSFVSFRQDCPSLATCFFPFKVSPKRNPTPDTTNWILNSWPIFLCPLFIRAEKVHSLCDVGIRIQMALNVTQECRTRSAESRSLARGKLLGKSNEIVRNFDPPCVRSIAPAVSSNCSNCSKNIRVCQRRQKKSVQTFEDQLK